MTGVDSMFSTADFLTAVGRLEQLPAATFAEAEPFPHVVIDDLFPAASIHGLHEMMWKLGDSAWAKSDDAGIEVKWRSKWRSEFDIPETAREIVRFLNSGLFLRELSRLSGIPHLIPDPYYTGGGFNLIRRGGHLDVHVDGNWHDAMQVHRRLNLILYLNGGWREEWGGGLHFYDKDGVTKRRTIAPRGNRTLIFETHDYSYHGHPEPLTCPEHEGRSSIILYYYTSTPRPESQVAVSKPHSALWRSKDWHDKRGNKTRMAVPP